MAVSVRFISTFHGLTVSKKLFFVKGKRLDQIIDQLESQIPGLKEKLLDSDGKLHPAYQVICTKGNTQRI